jgi:nitronate monooxygenase
MGVAVSGWRLAHAVSSAGQLGVVSGTALDVVLVRRLQQGDPGGHVRRALDAFPFRDVAQRIKDKYFNESGVRTGERFKTRSKLKLKVPEALADLLVASNFVEVFLAKEGHDGKVGINYLEKLQAPTLHSLFGAMLAGVDYVLMGAGIPRAIPGILDRLSRSEPVELKLDVKGATAEDDFKMEFNPMDYFKGKAANLKRPDFLPIISSFSLAKMLVRRATGAVQGFIVEGPTAGGHNAPPRGKVELTEDGEPIYGEKDVADLDAIGELGLPFWLAGSYGRPEAVSDALAKGATGVQVGTLFAYCEESGFTPEIKEQVLDLSNLGKVDHFTDPHASPTGFPFKVVQMEGTLSEKHLYEDRTRICDLGYLRAAYKKSNGSLGWRCSAEPVKDFVRKGGDAADAVGRKCLCNTLLSSVGMAQTHVGGEIELPMVTSGDDVKKVARMLRPGQDTYTAQDVLDYLLPDIS